MIDDPLKINNNREDKVGRGAPLSPCCYTCVNRILILVDYMYQTSRKEKNAQLVKLPIKDIPKEYEPPYKGHSIYYCLYTLCITSTQIEDFPFLFLEFCNSCSLRC